MLSSPSPSRLLHRLLGCRRADDSGSPPSETSYAASADGSRAERARREARHWLAMREREFARRLDEREVSADRVERAS